MQTIKASEFKATCLQLMDWVQASGDEVVITKNGRPVSRLVPYHQVATSLFGLHKGQVIFTDDLLCPIDEVYSVDVL
jgi:prevent-host-death family protein